MTASYFVGQGTQGINYGKKKHDQASTLSIFLLGWRAPKSSRFRRSFSTVRTTQVKSIGVCCIPQSPVLLVGDRLKFESWLSLPARSLVENLRRTQSYDNDLTHDPNQTVQLRNWLVLRD